MIQHIPKRCCRVMTRPSVGPCRFGQSVFNSLIDDKSHNSSNKSNETEVEEEPLAFDGTSAAQVATNGGSNHCDEILINVTETNDDGIHNGRIHLALFNNNNNNNNNNKNEAATATATTTSASDLNSQFKTWNCVPMGRAKNCPTLSSSSSSSTAAASKTNNNNNNNNSSSSSSSNNNTDNNTDNNQTTTKKEKPFVSTAVVGLVTTGDHLLLTRRPSYMRSFPGAFVFPGGGVHDGETLSQAATREVYEETNVTVPVDNWNLECVWESVYPTSTSIGPISAHHIVCYLSGRALPDDDDDEDHDDTTTKELNQPANDGRHVRLPTVKLCDDEVDGAIWLSRDDMEWIIQSSSGKDVDAFYQEKRTVDLITTKRLLSTMTIDHIPLCDASGIYPRLNDEGSVCGMAQGSLFALEHFCSKI